jgi:hypothetical protein
VAIVIVLVLLIDPPWAWIRRFENKDDDEDD